MSSKKLGAPGGPVVSLAQARAFVLSKQGLSGVGHKSVYDATLSTAGVYSTAPTCYLSYAARVKGFRLADLDQELYEKRRLVRLRCMRQSAYIEPAEALPAVHAATNPGGEKAFIRLVRLSGLTDGAFATLAERIEKVLAGHPPVTVPELRTLLGEHAPKGQAMQYVVALMSRQARLVRAEVRGSWTSDTYTYARWADWVGAPLKKIKPETARAELAQRYLRAFGPVTAADLKWWTGWTLRDTTAAIAALGDDVHVITLTDPETPPVEALVLADEQSKLLATNTKDASGVRLLPYWDAYTMGYIDRRRFVAQADYARVYDRAGNGTSVVLIDGLAEGVWEFETSDKNP